MPANQSTPEVTRADRQSDIIRNVLYRSKMNGCSADVYDTADEIVQALAAATPARGGDELRGALEQIAAAETQWANATVRKMADIARKALASTDMAGAGEKCSDCGGLNIGCPDGCVAPPVEGLTSGEGGRYADGYAQGLADAERQHQWMQDKAWQDAVLMLVHYQTLAERTWLVGHEEAAAKLAEWWKLAKALAETKSVEDIAAAPKATATASVRACVEAVRGIGDDYQTSAQHHPGHVLIPLAKFEQLQSAEAALTAPNAEA